MARTALVEAEGCFFKIHFSFRWSGNCSLVIKRPKKSGNLGNKFVATITTETIISLPT